ncbi:hypothetical protein [Saccharicrinis aurantiacus]|uniref:hypothetical protein n=1 Tax=Saccharicrinis aurantiacus TaxID=1849719 RepID=UPI000838B7E5|nr:hypothetical protein [Saccharicrinis aurantiacus]
MDALTSIIKAFSKSDVIEFSSFINRQKRKENRKDLELFLLLHKNTALQQNEIVPLLYETKNVVAYHALRKKLLKHLSDFILFKQLREDDTAETQVTAYISLTRYLKEHSIYNLAWKYLKKAEQMAVSSELFSLANQIMRLFLEIPLHEVKQDITPILERKEKYLNLAIEDDKIDTAYKIIQYYLRKSKSSVHTPDMQSIIDDTLNQYNLNEALAQRPSVVYRLLSITRSAATSSKDYYSFEPILLKYYSKIIVSDKPTERDKIYLARIQYMIAHTLFRNKQFKQATEYVDILKEQMQLLVKTEYTKLLPKVTQLQCALLFFTGKIDDAIDTISLTSDIKFQPNETLNLKLNKAIYLLFKKNFKEAIKVLSSIAHSNAWCAKIAGIEWVIKKDILDIFIQFELGNFDIASNRIRALLRRKEWFGNLPQLDRVKVFLQLLSKVVEEPDIAETSAFYDTVENSFNWIPIEQEDLHASVYYAWLKAKIMNDDAYEVLLHLISIEDE